MVLATKRLLSEVIVYCLPERQEQGYIFRKRW